MDIEQALEYPLPILKLGVQELEIRAKGEHVVNFPLKNSGGGTLEGQIISPVDSLRFEPSRWKGNRQEISCRFTPGTLEGWKPGDVRDYMATIISNGGETELPISVRLAKMEINTSEGMTIANLQDFFAYSQSHPEAARELFVNSEFHMLLLAMKFPYTDAYTLLAKEPNLPRALDNFFILAGLKTKTHLEVKVPKIEHWLKNPAGVPIIYGHFDVVKSDSGYVEAAITSDAPWLKLSNDSLTIADFSPSTMNPDDIKKTVNYTINPKLVTSRFARANVTIKMPDSPAVNVEIVVKRLEPLRAWISKEGYSYQDRGMLVVENLVGGTLQVQIFCKEQFVRFADQQYTLEDRLEIPFMIKLSHLQSAQMLFRKIPALHAEIEISSSYKNIPVKKVLKLVAGEW